MLLDILAHRWWIRVLHIRVGVAHSLRVVELVGAPSVVVLPVGYALYVKVRPFGSWLDKLYTRGVIDLQGY